MYTGTAYADTVSITEENLFRDEEGSLWLKYHLLQMCSNNLNQYAKAANENGRVYAADMEDLRQRLDELIDIGRKILSRLAEL